LLIFASGSVKIGVQTNKYTECPILT